MSLDGEYPYSDVDEDYYHVSLTNEEVQKARRLAEGRDSAKIGAGRIDADQDRRDVHRRGVEGEIAVARYLGVDVDEQVYSRGDDGSDLTYNTFDIDVKTTQHDGIGRALISVDKWEDDDLEQPDIYIFTERPQPGEITIVGMVTDTTVEDIYNGDLEASEGYPWTDNPTEWPRDTNNIIIPRDLLRELPVEREDWDD